MKNNMPLTLLKIPTDIVLTGAEVRVFDRLCNVGYSALSFWYEYAMQHKLNLVGDEDHLVSLVRVNHTTFKVQINNRKLPKEAIAYAIDYAAGHNRTVYSRTTKMAGGDTRAANVSSNGVSPRAKIEIGSRTRDNSAKGQAAIRPTRKGNSPGRGP